MTSLKQALSKLGIDEWIFGLAGLGALFFSILSVLGVWPFNSDDTLKIIVGAVGAILLAIFAQSTRRHADIENLKRTIGVVESELLDHREEFGHHLALSIGRTMTSATDTSLSSSTPRLVTNHGFSGSQAEYQKILYKRVVNNEISFRLVVVIHHKQKLEDIIFKLLLHEGHRFYIQHYDAPPKAFPLLNLMSFDNETYYVGGYNTESSPEESKVLKIKEPNTAELLRAYWTSLWQNAIPLNPGSVIDWDELKRISLERFNISPEEFDNLVSEIRKKADAQKRKLR